MTGRIKTTLEQGDEVSAALRAEAVRIIDEVWRRAETAARQETIKAIPNWGERALEQNERFAINALVEYQAENTGLSPFHIETTAMKFFGVQRWADLKAWNFDQVMRYLTDFHVTGAASSATPRAVASTQ